MPKKRLSHDWYPGNLPGNITIGEGSWLYSSYAFLHYKSTQSTGIQIGKGTGIYDGTFFDLGPSGTLQIGSYTTIVGAIIRADTAIEIGDYCLIAHEVVLADEAFGIPGEPTMAQTAASSGKTIKIRNNCWIAAGAILLGGADIGDDSIVGAHTIIDFKLPKGKMAVGNPARIIDLPTAKTI